MFIRHCYPCCLFIVISWLSSITDATASVVLPLSRVDIGIQKDKVSQESQAAVIAQKSQMLILLTAEVAGKSGLPESPIRMGTMRTDEAPTDSVPFSEQVFFPAFSSTSTDGRASGTVDFSPLTMVTRVEPLSSPDFDSQRAQDLIGPVGPAGERVTEVPATNIAESDMSGSDPPVDPELGVIRVRDVVGDPELGIIRIREQPQVTAPATGKPPIAYLTARLSGVSSDNIFLTLNEDSLRTGDEFLRPGLTFALYPRLGPKTSLVAAADVNFQRYATQSDSNYNEVRFRLGVRQGLFPRTLGQVSVSYQQLFRDGFQDQFFENTAINLLFSRRDPLTRRLLVDSYYQAQLNFSTPDSFNRFNQYMGAYLRYNINPQWETGVSYQLTLADYTDQERHDTFHQLIGSLTYNITPSVSVGIYGGFSTGRSSEPNVNFNDSIFGINLNATFSLF